MLALTALCVSMPLRAEAAEPVDAGPFTVEGPEGGYVYENGKLVISSDGVTVLGMDGASAADDEGNDIHIEAGVSRVTFESGVSIESLTDERSTTLWLNGDNNAIQTLDSARDTVVRGPGSVTIGSCTGGADITEATVSLTSSIGNVTVWKGGTLVLGPGAQARAITVFGGTLDLSHVNAVDPVWMNGYSIGSAAVATSVVVPFGTAGIDELISATNRIVANATIDVYSDGEKVGHLEQDGTVYYTATRSVTFVGFDGEVLKAEHVRLFQPAQAPAVPEVPGYEFLGWDGVFDRVSRDMIVAARYEALSAPPDNSSGNPDDPSDAPGNDSSGAVPNGPSAADSHAPAAGGRATGASAESSSLSATGDPFAAVVGMLASLGGIGGAAGLFMRHTMRKSS